MGLSHLCHDPRGVLALEFQVRGGKETTGHETLPAMTTIRLLRVSDSSVYHWSTDALTLILEWGLDWTVGRLGSDGQALLERASTTLILWSGR